MRPSDVRLEHYVLTSLSIAPVDGYVPNFEEGLYPKFSNADFEISVRLGEPMEDNDNEYLVHLNLSARPKEDKLFPYKFSVGADAVLTFQGRPDDSKCRELVLVNGASMLYSALRESLFTLTTRFPNGPMMLPSVSFIELRDELLRHSAQPSEEIAPPTTAVQSKKIKAKSTKK